MGIIIAQIAYEDTTYLQRLLREYGDAEGKNRFEGERTRFVFRPILKGRHRVLYHQKVRTVYEDLIRSVKDLNFDLAHATTLFSDGPIAYRLWQERTVPYVVTVRNTDINDFLAMAPWAWPIGMKVLKHAQKIYQSIV